MLSGQLEQVQEPTLLAQVVLEQVSQVLELTQLRRQALLLLAWQLVSVLEQV